MTFDKLMQDLIDLNDDRRNALYWATNYEQTTSKIRAEQKRQAVDLEIQMRELILQFVKGEQDNA